ncbi:MAG: hypothetical protein ABI321_23495, partial [Polyangia bacterium]
GTITLDDTHVHSGSQAAYVRVDQPTMNEGGAYVGLQLPISPLPTNLYVRAFFYRPAGDTQMELFFIKKSLMSDRSTDGLYADASKGNSSVVDVIDGNPASMKNSSVTLKEDAWSCVQWSIVGIGSPDAVEVTLAIDGVVGIVVPASSGYSTDSAFSIGQVVVAGDVAPVEFWVDDLELSSMPIGCDL